jgi:hypothetical protein
MKDELAAKVLITLRVMFEREGRTNCRAGFLTCPNRRTTPGRLKNLPYIDAFLSGDAGRTSRGEAVTFSPRPEKLWDRFSTCP